MSKYEFTSIENKWREGWNQKNAFTTPKPSTEKPPYYILVMFPYPSGHLHMGHVRNYTIGDVLARYYRRKNRSVLHPIGWDSFGLPAENAAIKNAVSPAKWTWENIQHMRGQLQQLGISYDWDREIATCHPDYYKWNQWLFIKMLEKGLVYRKKAPVNWCPSCQTVLANEQVHDNQCWRCGSEVSSKELEQWFFKITQYANELLAGHEQIKPKGANGGWPEKVLAMQKNWIGQSQGASVHFPILEPDNKKTPESIKIFTTRPDTLFGATFMVISPEHPLVSHITQPEHKSEVEDYVSRVKKISRFDRISESREKTGVFTGTYAENPVNGERTPIWIADYVLMDYGTGAIMAVPAHDERDFAFAQKYKIPIIQVIQDPDNAHETLESAYTGPGKLVNSGSYSGMDTAAAKNKICADLEEKKKGEATITYRLRDWLLSRQRFWGTPIPIVYCQKCGVVPVSLDDLPVKLPEDAQFSGQGESPLKQDQDWLKTTCAQCKGPALRETDTMDTFVDSSWYYARYTDPHNSKSPFDPERGDAWLPVSQYVGGIEHATMHLIYSRFFHKVMRDMGLLKSDEPFSSLLTQGMVTLGGSAMSKSKGNVVDPEDVISQYGVDSCRLFILFAAPPTQQLDWSDSQVGGVFRFLNRLWRLAHVFFDEEDKKTLKRSIEQSQKSVNANDVERQIHLTIKRVTQDISVDFGFNTAISAIMELVNCLYLYPDLGDSVSKAGVEVAVQLLEPFAPHISEEIWEKFGHQTPLYQSQWLDYNSEKLIEDKIQVVVQLNGKLKDRITVPTSTAEEDVKKLAKDVLVKKGIQFEPKRIIYVKNKLINFVVAR